VVALDRAGASPTLTAAARKFLADRFEAGEGWRADWYDNRHYATYEIGKALPEHPHTAQAVASLKSQQNLDGGFSPTPSMPSTPAATGCALALLAEHVEAGNPALVRALDSLVLAANADGSWPGPTGMYGPRPFLSDYAMQTHALCLLGAASVLRLWTSVAHGLHHAQPRSRMIEDPA
jgi:squalene-hopene/tetraprenyl-beta-curcumene cyclase